MEDKRRFTGSKLMATIASGVLLAPFLAGCGSGSQSGANLPPVDDSSRPQQYASKVPQQQRQGMSTTKKVVLLAGAAALYYMYKKNKEQRAQGNTSQPQYYLSQNGRVYYRDQSGRAHWVTPPPQGIQVPADQAQEYSGFQGYNNQPTGRTLNDMYQGNNGQPGYASQGGY